MDGLGGDDRDDPQLDERRRAAAIAFLGASLHSPPSTAALVAALADARRAVAAHDANGLAVGRWLAGEVALRGIRENAAVLAALQIPGRREEFAQAYRQQHPDRTSALNDLLAVLDQPGRGVTLTASWERPLPQGDFSPARTARRLFRRLR